MNPQMYLVFTTLLQALQFDTWVGLSYAHDYAEQQSLPYAYPVPPTEWNNEAPPWSENNQPPPYAYTYFVRRSQPLSENPMVDQGAVFTLHPEILRFSTAPLTLPDGSEFYFDISANMLTYEQLPPEE